MKGGISRSTILLLLFRLCQSVAYIQFNVWLLRLCVLCASAVAFLRNAAVCHNRVLVGPGGLYYHWQTVVAPESQPRSVDPNRGVHRLAILTTLAMFPLIWFGGLTTSHQAGMSVPDWPNTYGYNMFAVPFSLWLSEHAGGIFYEHTHRLLGSLVGFLALSTALYAWGFSASQRVRRWTGWSAVILGIAAVAAFVAMRLSSGDTARHLGHAVSGFGGLAAVGLVAWLSRRPEPRRWVRWSATALLLAVSLQGLLGGLRVTEVNLNLAIVHGIFAQLTLCFAGFLVLATSRWWSEADPVAPAASWWTDQLGSRQRLTAAATGTLTLLIFAQLVVAAVMRHYEAGLAVPDFPLSYGELAPPISAEGLARANEVRAFDYHLEPVSLAQIWLHTAHRIGAVLVTLGVAWVVWGIFRVEHFQRLRRHGLFLACLLVVQVCLGVATVWMAKPADIATAHVAVGALLLLTSWLLTLRVARLYGWRPLGAAETAGPSVRPAVSVPGSASESAPAGDLRMPVSV